MRNRFIARLAFVLALGFVSAPFARAASAPKYIDRVLDQSNTPNAGTYTLTGAVTGYRAFSALGNGNSAFYYAEDVATGDWEIGLGTYTSSGTTLNRDAIYFSSNSNTAVSWSTGTRRIGITIPSFRLEQTVCSVSTNTIVSHLCSVYLVDATSGNLTITLQSAALRGGFPVQVKKIDSSANTVTIARVGSDLIDGATSDVLSGQYAAAVLHPDGASPGNYYIF